MWNWNVRQNAGRLNSFLVIRGGALGDFILTLPALAALRRQFPDCELHVLARPRYAALAVAAGLARNVHSIDSPRLAGLFAPDSSWEAEIGEYFAQFDGIISYLHDPLKVFQSNVARCSRARFIVGPHRLEELAPLHATQSLLSPLEILGISGADNIPSLALPAVAAPALLPAKWLAVHPGSGSERKNWPEPKWIEFCARVIERTQWNLFLIGGEAELGRTTRLAAHLPPGRAQIAQDWPLLQLAAAMRQCAAFVGHDSGITHLAAALGLPGIVLWADTNEDVWRPQSAKFKVLRSQTGIINLEVEMVFGNLQTVL